MQIVFFLLLAGNSRMIQCRGGEMLSICERHRGRFLSAFVNAIVVVYSLPLLTPLWSFTQCLCERLGGFLVSAFVNALVVVF